MSDCSIVGSAWLCMFDNGPAWVKADPEVHISDELLASPKACACIEAKYDIGERCPHSPRAVHARLKS